MSRRSPYSKGASAQDEFITTAVLLAHRAKALTFVRISCSLSENRGSRKQDLATTKDWQHGTDGPEERNDVDMQRRSATLNTDKRRGY
ncbi:hypothetical protein DPX16_6378 [Anabarilius grahami]|uniref:Uncharacterized protein n=1 Tax=Anabarilius grahami TaxID=495550 RepID=A0A3N0YVH0_ANAGA|nr:hypothetical protein DPX16_6378 [Anabarilius grahami]